MSDVRGHEKDEGEARDAEASGDEKGVGIQPETTTSPYITAHNPNTISDFDFIRQSLDISEDVAKCLEQMDADLNHVDDHETTAARQSRSTSVNPSPSASSVTKQESRSRANEGSFIQSKSSPWFTLFQGTHAETLVFASRISISTTLASLFLLAFPLSNPYYQSIWIFITTSIVAWQPSIDAGTTFKKFLERVAGTILGAVLAFSVGYLSLLFRDVKDQAIFLGFAIAIEGFLYPYIADRLGYRGSYSALMGNLTFGVAVYGFYNQQTETDPYKPALFRVINIVIGCAIVGAVSLVVYPVSTKMLIAKNVRDLVASTGRSTELILQTAADSFESGRKPLSLVEVLWSGHGNPEADQVHNMYLKNLEGWKNCKLLIPTLKYDPWFWLLSHEEKRLLKHYMTTQVARTFRVQLNAVLIDSIIRSDSVYRGPSDALELFREIGATIRRVLDFREKAEERQDALKMLLERDLPKLRSYVASFAEATHMSTQLNVAHLESILLSKLPGLPLSFLDSQGEQTLLFFQLLEQLILRVARLHFYCQQYDEVDGTRGGCRL